MNNFEMDMFAHTVFANFLMGLYVLVFCTYTGEVKDGLVLDNVSGG